MDSGRVATNMLLSCDRSFTQAAAVDPLIVNQVN